MSVLRVDPPQFCAYCDREVRVTDRAVVFGANEIFHALCFSEKRRYAV